MTWPVPLTNDDVSHIRTALEKDEELIVAASQDEAGESRALFSTLHTSDSKLKSFSHTLEKRGDGRCCFLTLENACMLHQRFGADAKPAMCRLFPYTFTPTPTGIYVSVSFASTGALFNNGRLLSEQRDVLEHQYEIFTQLFQDYDLDWTDMQIADGVPLRWMDYLHIEKLLLTDILPNGEAPLKRFSWQLLDKSKILLSKLPSQMDLDNAHLTKLRPKHVDQVLLKELMNVYFPSDVFGQDRCEFKGRAFLEKMVTAPDKINLVELPVPIDFGAVSKLTLGALPDNADILLRRFFFCRIFSKLYFGPGLGSLSLVAGFHHLCLLIALIRLRIKVELIRLNTTPDQLTFEMVAEIVRALERRLTVSWYSLEATAVLEVLLQSPARLERILSLAS